MHHPFSSRTPFFSRPAVTCAVAAALLSPWAHASDVSAESPALRASANGASSDKTAAKKNAEEKGAEKKSSEKKPEGKPKGEALAATTETVPTGRSLVERRDPLDIVRERLAEKLSTGKAGKTGSSGGPSSGGPSSGPSSESSGGSSVVRVMASPAAVPVAIAVMGPAPSSARVAPRAAKAVGSIDTTAKKAAEAHLAAKLGTHSALGQAPHWDYQGDSGPQAWAQLKNEFATCANGKRQSPIDIRDGIKVQLDAVQFDYRATNFRVLDNGHTVQVNVNPGNFIEVTGKRFELLQFHFHRPSEERINGRLFDMVAHLVHKDVEGRLAVVAVLLDRGNAQPLVQAIWNNLPLEKGDEVTARLPIDLNDLLPADRSYYTYMGSLTTPPCSEGVLWMVMKTPVTLSAEQIAIFSKLYPMNARPIQSASGRLIKESN